MDSEKLEAKKKAEIETELRALLDSGESLKRHMVRDVIELVSRNETAQAIFFPTLSSLGLNQINAVKTEGAKLEVTQKHPEWAEILNDPATEIPKLIQGSDEQIQKLRQIIDVIDDDEIKLLIAQNLLFPVVPLDDHHQQAAVQTFEAILNKDNWGSKTGSPKDHLLAKTFKANSQIHLSFIEAALKAKDAEMRRAAAISLAYAKGHELSPLFEKALNDESEDVSKAAISSLRYRQPSDRKTHQLLQVTFLNHPKPEVRKEIVEMILAFYPNSESSAEEEVSEPHPILTMNSDDPRAAHLSKKFKKLGLMHFAGGVIWSGVSRGKMTQDEAKRFCGNHGAKLPTVEQYQAFSRSLGSRDPGREDYIGYHSDGVPGNKDNQFWSSSGSLKSDLYRMSFSGTEGFTYYSYHTNRKSVRCIAVAR